MLKKMAGRALYLKLVHGSSSTRCIYSLHINSPLQCRSFDDILRATDMSSSVLYGIPRFTILQAGTVRFICIETLLVPATLMIEKNVSIALHSVVSHELYILGIRKICWYFGACYLHLREVWALVDLQSGRKCRSYFRVYLLDGR